MEFISGLMHWTVLDCTSEPNKLATQCKYQLA